MTPRSITLTPQVEERIRQKVAFGPYNSDAEVVEEALRLLEVRDLRVQQLRDSIAEGLAAVERGEGIELTAESINERVWRSDERARRGETPHPDVCP